MTPSRKHTSTTATDLIKCLLLPRDAMRKHGLCPVTVTLVYCIHMAKDIVKLLSRPSSPIILVFDPQRQFPIPMGTPSAGTQNTRGIL